MYRERWNLQPTSDPFVFIIADLA